MPTQTNEQALESAIEKALTGTSLEEIKAAGNLVAEPRVVFGGDPVFQIGFAENFDAQYAIDTAHFWNFLETTQAEELEKLKRSSDWKLKILSQFDKRVKKYGVLDVLRKGLSIEDAKLIFFYETPLASSSETIKKRFKSNEFSITRQVRYNLDKTGEEIDMVVFLNGIPLATIELKNHWTGQSARVQGIKQYKTDRDPKQPLLNFARCLVHFAVDTDEVFMTTKLSGSSTFFLPFNKGHNHGAGNPPNEQGFKTSYLWDEVLRPRSLANIIQHFVLLEKKDNKLAGGTLFFPRYHQMDVVRKLITDCTDNGVGNTYLIQHSAGSGKSNSITWAAYQLIETYPKSANLPGAKAIDSPLFDSVIVVTDRRLLDKQLRENIKGFSEVKNIVAPAHSSQDLKTALEGGKRIIITTIQKFPFIVDGIADLSDRRFAVIIDEAHSSQSGTSAANMNAAMGTDEMLETIAERIKSRQMKANASYFAFTATPKNTTLERFGQKQADGTFTPFHLYSMKQAIEEGFILDVLANYTTYKSYYEIEKSIADNPEFDTKKAQKRLRAFVEKDKRTISTKAEIMLDHFMTQVVKKKRLKSKGKGMVVTQSIESAIRYYKALKDLLDQQGNPFKIAIAFSGKKKLDGVEYTEPELNGFAENKTREHFDEDEYRLLVVANKYLTGFDQQKLCAMYVDKKLQGVLCVQALSRLNRSCPKLGKKTEDLFILDFFNETEDIKKAFDPFYTSTTLNEGTDANVLHELKDNLDDAAVYEWHEVEEFYEKYFANAEVEELHAIIDVCAERFNSELDLDDEQKADFKIKAKQFVKIYAQISSIMDFTVDAWEQLFWTLKFLIPKLIVRDPQQEAIDELLNAVDLSTYGLERTKLNQTIGLDDSETGLDPQNSNPRGSHGGEEETDELDEIIKTFNDKWFQGWDATPEDQREKLLTFSRRMRQHKDYARKVAQNSNPQTRKLAREKIMAEVMAAMRKDEIEFYKLYAKDEAFRKSLEQTMERLENSHELI